MIRYFALLLGLCLFSHSCTQERDPCLTPKIASFNIVCVHMPTDTSTVPVDTTLVGAYFCPVTLTGTDTVKFPQSATFTISLASNANSCIWLFTTDSLHSRFDTLEFFYQRQLQFLSNACGFAYFYNLDSFHTSHYNIDSAHILANSVTNNVNTTQFKIYIHPDY